MILNRERTFFDLEIPGERQLWFVSDTHFGHRRLVTGSPDHFDTCRTYATTDEMDADIRKKWLAAVGDGDTVVFLGDLMFGNFNGRGEEAARDLLDSLPGDKVLVRGNHDQKIRGELLDCRDYAAVRWRGMTYLCQHVPFGNGPGDDMSVLASLKEGLDPATTVLVHGHTHFTDRYSRTGSRTFSLQNNACWEAWYGMVDPGRLYPANRTYVGKCLGHQVVGYFKEE
jgi:calcineurin-like phosphoesterase family protein